MISSILCAGEPIISGGGGGTGGVAAVHFDGATSLRLDSLSGTDNGFFSFAGWLKTDWSQASDNIAFIVDPENIYGTFLLAENPGGGFVPSFGVGGSAPGADIEMHPTGFGTGWQQWIGTAKADAASGSKILKVYINDVDHSASFTDGVISFNVAFNGKSLWIGSDGFGDWFVGDMCDLSIWPGVSFLTGSDINVTTRRYFIDGSGNRVAPSVAIAALGTPAAMLTGGASSFASNSLGSAGAFTVNNGALTNASFP